MVRAVDVLLVGEKPAMGRLGRLVRRALPQARLRIASHAADFTSALERLNPELVILQQPPAWTEESPSSHRARVRWPGCLILWLLAPGEQPDVQVALQAGVDGVLVDAADLPQWLPLRLRLDLARRARERSDSDYRSLFDHLPVGLYRTSPRGQILDANPELVRMLGFVDRESLLAHRASDFYVHPPQRRTVLDRHRRADVLSAVEIELRRADGQTVWVEDHARPLRDSSGRIVAYEGTLLDITRRKEAEAALRAREERFRALVHNASDILVTIAPQGTMLSVTPSAERVLGYAPGALVGRDGFSLIHPDDVERARGKFADVVRRVNPGIPIEFRFRHADGSWVALEVIGNNLLDRPEVGAIVLTAREVSERKRAEAALRESERRLSTLMGNLRGMAYRCRNDPDWTMEFVSGGCLGLTGFPPEDLLNSRRVSYASLIHPDDQQPVWDGVQAAVREGQPYQLTYRIVTAQGEARWVWEQGGAVGYGEDGIEVLEGFITDISDRVAAEQELRTSRAWLQHVVESIDDLLVVYDGDGRYVDIITRDQSLLMRPAGEMLGRTLTDILPPDVARRFLAGIDIVLTQGAAYDFEYPLDLPGGERWFRARGRRVRSSESDRPLTLWSISDVTERKATERALLRQSRQLEVLSRTSQQLNAVLEIPAVLRALVASGMDLVDASAGTAGLWTDGAMHFSEINRDGLLQSIQSSLAPGEGVPGVVAETRRSYLANDPAKDPHLASAAKLGIRNLVNVPIISREGELLGCLEVHNRRRGEAFDETDVSMLEGLASSAAVALENARLLEERLQAEAELRLVKEFNEDIVQSMGEGIVVQDRLGRFTFVNPAAAAMLGYAPEELLGEPWTKVVPPDQHAIVREVDANRQVGGASRYELEFVRKDGRRLPALVSGSSRFRDGRFIGMLAVFADITDRKQAERALLESEEQLRSVTDRSPNMIFINQDGRNVYANPQCSQTMGYSSEELLAPEFRFESLVAPESLPVVREAFAAHARGQDVPPYEYGLVTRDGRRLTVLNATKLISFRGRPAILGVVTDISQRIRAEAALRASEARFRAFFEYAALGIALTDEAGRVLECNAAFQAIPGLTEAAARQQHVWDWVDPQDAELTRSLYADLCQDRRGPFQLEIRFRDAAGGLTPTRVTASRIPGGGGDLATAIWMVENVAERKRAEQALRESERRFRLLVERAADAVFLHDMDGAIVDVNQQACESLGYARDELLKLTVSEVEAGIPDTDRRDLWRELTSGAPRTMHGMHRRKDGSTFPVELRVGGFDIDGRPYILALARDVTERQRAEAAIERHARELSVLYETSLEVARRRGAHEVLQVILAQAAGLLGAARGGIYLARDDRAGLELAVLHNLPAKYLGTRLALGEGLSGRVALTGQAQSVDDYAAWEGRFPGYGDASFRRVAAAPLTRAGIVIGVINVTDDRRTDPFEDDEIRVLQLFADQAAIALENAQLLEETRHRAAHLEAITSVAAALRAVDRRSDMLPVVLARLQELIGARGALLALEDRLTREIVVPCASGDWTDLTGTHHAGAQDVFADVMASGTPDWQLEAGTAARDSMPDSMRLVPAVALVPLVEQEKVVGLLGVGRSEPFGEAERSLLLALAEVVGNALHRADVLETLEQRVHMRTRELAEANERLRELDRLKSNFVSNVSHELRTPITNVLLYLDLLKQPGREDRRETYMQVLHRESERLGRLIEDLLTLSRMDQAALKISRELHALDPLLAEVVAAHRARAQAKGVALALEPNAHVPPIWIGYQTMIQVFNNLVGNAVAYTPGGGHVTLSSQTRPIASGALEVGVRVWNDGPAIPPEDLPQLFQRFFRGQTGRASGESGTGLGLAICKEIVDRHGGRIDVHSTPDSGTSFTVWLPIGEEG